MAAPPIQESRVDYVMGSGNHVSGFLHRTERGTPIELSPRHGIPKTAAIGR